MHANSPTTTPPRNTLGTSVDNAQVGECNFYHGRYAVVARHGPCGKGGTPQGAGSVGAMPRGICHVPKCSSVADDLAVIWTRFWVVWVVEKARLQVQARVTHANNLALPLDADPPQGENPTAWIIPGSETV